MSTDLLSELKRVLKQTKDKARECQEQLDDERAILEFQISETNTDDSWEFIKIVCNSIVRNEEKLSLYNDTIVALNIKIYKLQHGLLKEPEVNLDIE